MERFGLQHVRGCEVIELRDAEGKLMNDFTGRARREQWSPPKGTERTLLVALDTAQYQVRTWYIAAASCGGCKARAHTRGLTLHMLFVQMDVTRQVESAGPDVYAGLNLLVRRKPKENNFKAILECIRDLLGETTAVPEWLHDIFLGYGDPAAAQYRNMPDAVPTLDFKVRQLHRSLACCVKALSGHACVLTLRLVVRRRTRFSMPRTWSRAFRAVLWCTPTCRLVPLRHRRFASPFPSCRRRRMPPPLLGSARQTTARRRRAPTPLLLRSRCALRCVVCVTRVISSVRSLRPRSVRIR
jgi:hypothetical protein